MSVSFSELHILSTTPTFGHSPFECVDLQLRSHVGYSTLRLFVIDRPPSSSPNSEPFPAFLAEFRGFVKRIGIFIFGDFKVRAAWRQQRFACTSSSRRSVIYLSQPEIEYHRCNALPGECTRGRHICIFLITCYRNIC